MKYDKMIAVNKAESEQKIKKAIRAIDDMGARGLPISVTELVRWTGLSRGFFYKNVQVRQKLEEAIKQSRRIDVQQPYFKDPCGYCTYLRGHRRKIN